MVTSREITTTRAANFIPEIWAEDTRNAIEFEEVLTKVVNTQYEVEMAVGDILHIPLRSNLDTQTKTQGLSQTISYQAVTEGVQNITINTFQYAAQLLNHIVATQSKFDERQRIAHAMGYALMRGIEVSIAALPQSFSQIVGTLGADLDDANLRRGWQYLADAGVSTDAVWVFGPAAVASLFGNDKFTSKDFVSASSVIETATLPPLYSYPAVQSNLLRNPATGQTECFLAHREAMILIRQLMPTVRQQFKIDNIADGLVAYDIYNTSEATWVDEAPGGDSAASTGDFGAVLVRSA